jgi:hypothetical protein
MHNASSRKIQHKLQNSITHNPIYIDSQQIYRSYVINCVPHCFYVIIIIVTLAIYKTTEEEEEKMSS